MNYRPVLFLVAVLCLPLPGLGADAVDGSVRGAPSCGEWVAHRKKSDTLALSNATWLIGYLSGLSAGSGKNVLLGRDNAEVFAGMDRYCNANPLKDVAAGGKALLLEAPGRKDAGK